jgi:hypothetical protein
MLQVTINFYNIKIDKEHMEWVENKRTILSVNA